MSPELALSGHVGGHPAISALGGKADVAEFKAGIGGSNTHTIHSSMAVSQNQEGLRLLMTLSRPKATLIQAGYAAFWTSGDRQ
jgi:hypothetical protein